MILIRLIISAGEHFRRLFCYASETTNQFKPNNYEQENDSFFGSILLFGMFSCKQTEIVSKTVPELDIERYMGPWYEIARFDHSFERGLVGCMANYALQSDGMVKVTNTGYKNSLDGKYKESVGKAYRPDDKIPGKLKVSFLCLSIRITMSLNFRLITVSP